MLRSTLPPPTAHHGMRYREYCERLDMPTPKLTNLPVATLPARVMAINVPTVATLFWSMFAAVGVYSQTDTQPVTIQKWNYVWEVSDYAFEKTDNNVRTFIPTNVKGSPTDVVFTLNQTKTDYGVASSGAEIVSQDFFGFGTFEFTADMPMGVSGTVSAGFLYLTNSETEIDVEQQGNAPETFDFTNWTSKSSKDRPTSNAPGFAAGPHKFVIVWNPKKVEWSIDGRVVATHITNIPQKKAHFAFNCWGTNSPNWGGTATVNHQRQMTVSSFQFTPLTTGLHLPADQWKLLN